MERRGLAGTAQRLRKVRGNRLRSCLRNDLGVSNKMVAELGGLAALFGMHVLFSSVYITPGVCWSTRDGMMGRPGCKTKLTPDHSMAKKKGFTYLEVGLSP